MILDQNLILSGSTNAVTGAWTGQSIAQAAGTYVSTNVIDLAPLALGNNQATDYGIGEDLDVLVEILTTVTSGGAATVQLQLVTADDAAISSNVTVLYETTAIGYATLTAGKQILLEWPRSTPFVPRRYLAVRYIIGTATTTAGTVAAAVVKDVQDVANRYYLSGFTVS